MTGGIFKDAQIRKDSCISIMNDIEKIYNFKSIECVINNADMAMFKLENLKKTITGYIYEEIPLRQSDAEVLTAKFDVEYSYEIFGLIEWWGGWNSTPSADIMKKVVKVWYEKYDAELIRISHDTLTFTCRKLSENEAECLREDAKNLYAEIIDCKPEKLIEHLMNKGTFTLWWD